MPRIRNTASFPAAAVSDTASVAATQRGPLHPSSQGPLAPRTAAVSDTAAVTVFDTVTVVPCLKKTLKYSTPMAPAQVQSTLREVDEEDDKNVHVFEAVARGLLHMEKHNKKVFDKVMKVYKKSHLRKALEVALVKYACGRAQEFKDLWKVCWADYMDNKAVIREHRRGQVKAHYEDLETVLAEADNSTPKVSFASATVKEFVLTEWERVHIKLGEASRKLQLLYELPWEPHTKYESFAPVPSQAIKRGGISAYVKDHMDLDDYSRRQLMLATRDWVRHGNVEALALHQQPLPRSNFTATATAVSDTASTSARRKSTVVSDTTAVQSTTSTNTNDVLDTSSAAAAVLDTAAQSQSTPSNGVLDTSSVNNNGRRASASVVTDTTARRQTSASVVTDTTARQASVVTDTTAVQSTPSGVVDTSMAAAANPTQPPTLRRSARIAARAASAPLPVRRTTRKGAVKPKGFYKV